MSFCRGSDSGLYQLPPTPRNLAEGYTSEDQLSLTLPGSGYYGGRESDQLSVSSSSSMGGPSPRERRCVPTDSPASGIYLPMAPVPGSLHSPASSSKVSVRIFLSLHNICRTTPCIHSIYLKVICKSIFSVMKVILLMSRIIFFFQFSIPHNN